MSDEPERYRLRLSRSAARALEEELPEKIAFAVWDLISGDLLDNPQRVGRPLEPPLAPAWSARRGTYRVLYVIREEQRTVEVTAIRHRADAYRA